MTRESLGQVMTGGPLAAAACTALRKLASTKNHVCGAAPARVRRRRTCGNRI